MGTEFCKVTTVRLIADFLIQQRKSADSKVLSMCTKKKTAKPRVLHSAKTLFRNEGKIIFLDKTKYNLQ